MKQQKGWRMSCGVGKATEEFEMSCDVGEVTERLENEICSCMSLTGPLISHLRFTSWAARQVT